MANAFITGSPQTRNALATDAPLGTGLAKAAADVTQLRQEWQRQYIDGVTELQFREWLEAQGISNPTLPR